MAGVLFLGFIAMILLRVPISMAIGAAVILAFVTSDFSDALYIVPQQILDGVNKASLAAVPFFIMAGNLMNAVGMTDRIFNFANALVGHFKAGLAQVNVLSSMIFAGVSGAAVADCAGLGTIEIKAMKERGYRADFAAAVTVCSAVVGPIIPPSIGLVIYAFLAQQSIERMFLAGLVPGDRGRPVADGLQPDPGGPPQLPDPGAGDLPRGLADRDRRRAGAGGARRSFWARSCSASSPRPRPACSPASTRSRSAPATAAFPSKACGRRLPTP